MVILYSGTAGDSWHEVRVDIPFFEVQQFKLVFEGIKGFHYQSDMAIDDVALTAGTCKC